MKVEKAEPLAPGNPFLSDYYNMGMYLGTNVAVMFGNHPDGRMEYLYVIDMLTGERVKISDFTQEEK